MAGAAIKAVGLHEDRKSVVYRVWWWSAFLIVLVMPTYADEANYYFPSILALAIAWLVTMPAYSQSLLDRDMPVLPLPPGLWKYVVASFTKAGVELPPEVHAPEVADTIDALAPGLLAVFIPHTLVRLQMHLSTRMSSTALVGVVGLLVGRTLAQVHLWHGWSPVSVLLAVSVPWVVLGVFSFVLAMMGAAFTSHAKLEASLKGLVPPDSIS